MLGRFLPDFKLLVDFWSHDTQTEQYSTDRVRSWTIRMNRGVLQNQSNKVLQSKQTDLISVTSFFESFHLVFNRFFCTQA